MCCISRVATQEVHQDPEHGVTLLMHLLLVSPVLPHGRCTTPGAGAPPAWQHGKWQHSKCVGTRRGKPPNYLRGGGWPPRGFLLIVVLIINYYYSYYN